MSKETINQEFPFINIDRNLLVKKVRLVNSVISKKSAMPIIENIRFDFKKELKSVYLTGTSLRDTIITKIDIDTLDFDATIMINCDDFIRIIDTLVDPNITLKSDALNLMFKSGTSSFKLPLCPDVNEFPKNPKMSKNKTVFTFDGTKFNPIIKNVSRFCGSDHEIRETLKTVQLSMEEGSLLLSATNSFTAAMKKMKAISGDDFSPILIPKESIPVIQRIVDGDSVEGSYDDNRICFTISDTKLYCGLSTEKPINMNIVRGLIEKHDSGFIIEKSTMASTLKTLATINTSCSISIVEKAGKIIASFVSNNNEKKQKSKIDSYVSFLKNDTTKIESLLEFNINSCLESLSLIDGDMLEISFLDNPTNSGIRLYSEEETDIDSAIFIMKIMSA